MSGRVLGGVLEDPGRGPRGVWRVLGGVLGGPRGSRRGPGGPSRAPILQGWSQTRTSQVVSGSRFLANLEKPVSDSLSTAAISATKVRK